jgi:hypothetical protein
VTKILALAMFAALLTNEAAAADPFAGKWKLNVRHSHYPAGSCPTSMVIEIEETAGGIRYDSDTRYRNGAETRTQYTAMYDGKPVIVTSSRGLMLPVSLKRIDARTVEASYSRGLQVIASSRRTVSPEGKRMKITTLSTDPSGKAVKTIGVYDKE